MLVWTVVEKQIKAAKSIKLHMDAINDLNFIEGGHVITNGKDEKIKVHNAGLIFCCEIDVDDCGAVTKLVARSDGPDQPCMFLSTISLHNM